MKGSSKLYDEFFREKREQDNHEDKPPEEEDFKDLFIFKEEDVQWFKERGCTLEKVNLEAGDLVLWYVLPGFLHLMGIRPDLAQGFSHHALRLLPSRQPYPSCPVYMHDARQVCEERGP
jgi:hypothetical protein